MSVRASQWAWEVGRGRQLGQGPRLTLLKVADHADQDGVCWPGEKHVAEYVGSDERTVRRHLKLLEGQGLLSRERVAQTQGRGRAHDRILLDLDQPDNLSGKKTAVQPDTGDALTGHLEHVQPDNGDHGLYREPSVEPSGTKTPQPPGGELPSPVEEIFEYWKSLTGRNGQTQLTPKRTRAVKARLKDSTPEEIRRAIVGCSRSDFHMKRGKHANRGGETHNDLTFILKSRDDVERFAGMAGKAPLPGVDPLAAITNLEKATAAWDAAKRLITDQVPDATFNTWIHPLEAAGERDGDLVLVETQATAGWVNRRYRTLICEALAAGDAGYTDFELVDETALELEAA